MEPNTNQTITVPKSEAQPNWVMVGFVVLGLLSGLVLFIVLPLFVTTWPTDIKPGSDGYDDMRNYFWSLGAVAAGLVALWGLAFAAVRTVALDRQAKTAERESHLNEQKHAAEAFATAIEQLGHDNYAVRLGAVYALESLARTSDTLHGPIFETLCAYVREEAPAPKEDVLPAQLEALGERDIDDIIHEHIQTLDKPDVVVQAILTIIGRRDPTRDPDNFRLDLQSTLLARATMEGGHFEQANLSSTHLEGAKLIKTHLEGAKLFETHLNGTFLIKAHLEGASFLRTHLEGASLWRAHLEAARLFQTHLKGANLLGVSFDTTTDVTAADFRGARNISARTGTDFRATVRGADTATWPDEDDPEAWDRGEEDEA